MLVSFEQFVVLACERLDVLRQVVEEPPEVGTRNASKVLALAGSVIGTSAEELVELAGARILLDLPVPDRPVMLEKPFAQLGEFVGRHSLDLFFDCLNFCHDHLQELRRW